MTVAAYSLTTLERFDYPKGTLVSQRRLCCQLGYTNCLTTPKYPNHRTQSSSHLPPCEVTTAAVSCISRFPVDHPSWTHFATFVQGVHTQKMIDSEAAPSVLGMVFGFKDYQGLQTPIFSFIFADFDLFQNIQNT